MPTLHEGHHALAVFLKTLSLYRMIVLHRSTNGMALLALCILSYANDSMQSNAMSDRLAKVVET